MKKIVTMVLCFMFMVSAVGCGNSNTYNIKINVPAGSTETFVFSDEEISAMGNEITVWSGEGLGDTSVILKPVGEAAQPEDTGTYLTRGMSVKFPVVKGEWYKVGISVQNNTDVELTFYVEVEGIKVRIK